MTVQYGVTPNYQIHYPLPQTTMADLAGVLGDQAAGIDAALTRGGIAPPNAADLVAVAGRVSTLEAANAARGYAALHQINPQTGLAIGWQTITLDAETEDSHNGHATGPGYTVPSGLSGVWEISGAVAFAALSVAGALVQTRVLVNGNLKPNSYGSGGPWSQTTGVLTAPVAARLVRLAAGDVVTVQGYYNNATWATSAAPTTGATSHLSLRRIGS